MATEQEIIDEGHRMGLSDSFLEEMLRWKKGQIESAHINHLQDFRKPHDFARSIERTVLGLDSNVYEAHGFIAFPSELPQDAGDPYVDENGGVHNLYRIDYKKIGTWWDIQKIKIIKFLRKLVN
jgi:hypothetical protein